MKYILLNIALLFTLASEETTAQWVQIQSPTNYWSITHLAVNDSFLFVGTNGGGIYRTTNMGSNWETINDKLPDLDIHALATNGQNLIAPLGPVVNLFRSTDNGANWSLIGPSHDSSYPVAIAWREGMFFVATSDTIFRSTDSTKTWTAILNTGDFTHQTAFWSISTGGRDFLVSTLNYVQLSSDNGENWSTKTLTDGGPIVETNGTIFLGHAVSGGVWLSKDAGQSFSWVGDGLNSSNGIVSLASDDKYLYTIVEGPTFTLWYRPISEMITSAVQSNDLIPRHYELKQNYPNPFNPTTTFEVSIPKATYVSLNIINVLGEEIETLVADNLEQGVHYFVWNGSHHSSGVYFYRMRCVDYVETKKLLLLK